MFVIYQKNMKKPIRVWLENVEQIEESCLEQAYHLADLPFLHKWVCLMPDTHTGKGMPQKMSLFQMQWEWILGVA